MSKYEVTIREIESYVLHVQAENQDDAIEKAYLLMDEGMEQYHAAIASESEAYQVD